MKASTTFLAHPRYSADNRWIWCYLSLELIAWAKNAVLRMKLGTWHTCVMVVKGCRLHEQPDSDSKRKWVVKEVRDIYWFKNIFKKVFELGLGREWGQVILCKRLEAKMNKPYWKNSPFPWDWRSKEQKSLHSLISLLSEVSDLRVGEGLIRI